MEEEDTLCSQLHKLSSISSEEALDYILTTLWKTRRSGLSSHEKTRFQSTLNLPSRTDLDLVLACLRLVIRKFVHEDLTGDHLLKLFPSDLSLHLQTMLLTLLHKHHTNWKQEISKHQVKINVPSSDLSSGISMPHCPHQDDPIGHLDPNDLPTYRPTTGDATTWQSVPVSIQQDAGPPDNLAILPRLTAMTWTMEKHNFSPANKAAIITLKLQDHTKSSSGEMDAEIYDIYQRPTFECGMHDFLSYRISLSSLSPHYRQSQLKRSKSSRSLPPCSSLFIFVLVNLLVRKSDLHT